MKPGDLSTARIRRADATSMDYATLSVPGKGTGFHVDPKSAAGRRDGSVRRHGGRAAVSEQAHSHRGALRAGHRDRQPGAAALRGHVCAAQAARGARQPGGRGGPDRRGACREIPARRLYRACRRDDGDRRESGALQADELQPAHRLRRGHRPRHHPAGHRRASERAGEQHEGVRGVREGKPRQAFLCLRNRRQHHSEPHPFRPPAARHDQHRLQEPAPGAHRRGRGRVSR